MFNAIKYMKNMFYVKNKTTEDERYLDGNLKGLYSLDLSTSFFLSLCTETYGFVLPYH